MNYRYVLLGLFGALLSFGAGASAGFYFSKSLVPPVSSPSTSIMEGGEIFSAPSYITKEITDRCATSNPPWRCDISLWGVDEDGVEFVIEENLTELFRIKTGFDDSNILEPFLLPDNSPRLVFRASVASSGCCSLYAFYVPTRTFELRGREYMASPNNETMVEFISNGMWLDIRDTLTERHIATIEVREGETFISGISAYSGDFYGNYRWLDNKTLEYNVYSTLEEIPEEGQRTPIDTRTFSLPD